MLHNERIIVLGGKKNHALLVQNLKALGAYVILIDKYESSFARQFADEHFLLDPFVYDDVKQVVQTVHPTRIVTIAIEKTIKVAARISEEFGLPFPFSLNEVLDFTEKDRMKAIFSKNAIPSARYQIVKSLDEVDSSFQCPLVVKPVDSCGSQGISKVELLSDLEKAVSFALDHSVNKEVVVEEFVEGDEYQVECFVQQGVAYVIMAKQKLKFLNGVISSQVGSLTEPACSLADYEPYRIIAQQIAQAFHISNGIFFYQAIKHNGSLSVIELGARLGGGWGYKMIKDITGFDHLRAAMNAQLGLETVVNYDLPKKYYLTNFFFAKKCVFDHIDGLDLLVAKGIIDDYDVMKKKGATLDGVLSNPNRVAIYMISADSIDALMEKMRLAIEGVDIVDAEGLHQMDKDMYRNFISRILKDYDTSSI